MRGRLLALCLLFVGCGDHQLDLSLALAGTSCTLPVPAGGSILYQVAIDDAADAGGANTLCGGCLAVTAPLPDANAIVAFLRSNAPACASVRPRSQLRIALTAWKVAGCSDSQPPTRVFCSQSQPVALPDGHADAALSVSLSCDPSCGANLAPPGVGPCVSGCPASACSPCCTDSYVAGTILDCPGHVKVCGRPCP